MDKATVKNFRKDLEAAIAAVGAKYKMNFSVGTIHYGSDFVRCKLTGAPKVAGASATQTPEMAALVKYIAKSFGVPPQIKNLDVNAFYTSFSTGDFKVVGYKPSRYKYPFSIKTRAGKQYKVAEHFVISAINGGKVK